MGSLAAGLSRGLSTGTWRPCGYGLLQSVHPAENLGQCLGLRQDLALGGGKGALEASNLAPRLFQSHPTRSDTILLLCQLCRERIAFGLKALYNPNRALPLLINLEQRPLLGRLRALLGSRPVTGS